jgi:hypothetical protein
VLVKTRDQIEQAIADLEWVLSGPPGVEVHPIQVMQGKCEVSALRWVLGIADEKNKAASYEELSRLRAAYVRGRKAASN